MCGMRNQEISTKLDLREHTVRNYLFRIFDKLGISSHVEVVLYAVRALEQIIAPPHSTGESARAITPPTRFGQSDGA